MSRICVRKLLVAIAFERSWMPLLERDTTLWWYEKNGLSVGNLLYHLLSFQMMFIQYIWIKQKGNTNLLPG